MFVAEAWRASWELDRQFEDVALAALSLALVVNYPHFLMSYKLAYTRGRGFVLQHWWQLIAVPIALLAMFAAAYALYDVPIERPAFVARPRLGDLVLASGFHLMILTIGWHYTKQVFGCMVVYAEYDRYPLSRGQRDLMRRSLFSIWAMSLVSFNIAGDWQVFSSFNYAAFDLPDVLLPVSQLVVGGAIALVVYKVFYANYAATGRTPSANMVVAPIALCIWWLPVTRQEEFFYILAPLFHSLQYLAFVYRIEDRRLRGSGRRGRRGLALAAGVVLAGWLAFESVPRALDASLATFEAWETYFFLVAATLFINIHHYFIDNVLWRLRDPRVRESLLG